MYETRPYKLIHEKPVQTTPHIPSNILVSVISNSFWTYLCCSLQISGAFSHPIVM